MILAITQRYELSAQEYGKYTINKEFKEIFENLNILLFPVATLTDLEKVVTICDGLIVTGGIDIDPKHYHENYITETLERKERIEENDTLDFTLIRAFNKVNKPILGICRGIQSINVCFGGSLYQHIENHKLPRENRHPVDLEKNSFLYELYHASKISVISTHHQSVKQLAKGFEIIAKSEDGIIEAIQKGNIIGIQWHPEYQMDIEFFEYFINKICRENN